MKKLINITIFLFALFGIANTTLAVNYFFTHKNTYLINNPQTYEFGPYSTIAICNKARTENINTKKSLPTYDPKYDTWTECSVGDNISITKMSPTEGVPGNAVYIEGKNFKKITKASIGNTNIPNPSLNSSGVVVLTIPSGATSGKITITDSTRGSASTTEEYKINTNGLMWYWSNENHQTMGKSGFQDSNGFATKAECDANRAEALKSRSVKTSFAECFQSTKSVMSNAIKSQQEQTGSSQEIQSKTGNKVFDEEYNLLVPLPGVDKVNNTNNLADYLNFFFKFAIAICAALAVLMIVIYGVQYMGDGSVFGHTEAKTRIGEAIMGLLLALGAYALLNTINPDLVGTNGIKIGQVSIELMTDDLPTQKNSNGTLKCDYSKSTVPMSMFTGKSQVVSGGVLTQNIHDCNGVDIGSTDWSGKPINVNAIADGTVISVVSGCIEGQTQCGSSYGNQVRIKHANGVESLYAHASKVVVKNGDVVKSGQKIMEMGNTGFSKGRHLHLNIYNAINPYANNALRGAI